MDLTLQKPGNHLFIRSVSRAGIQVIDDYYRTAIIISATEIVPDWPVRSVEDMGREQIEKILGLGPEVVLVGTGSRQVFLPPERLMLFYEQNVGVEVMTTDAACRTFNVLVSESRNVVAALLPV